MTDASELSTAVAARQGGHLDAPGLRAALVTAGFPEDSPAAEALEQILELEPADVDLCRLVEGCAASADPVRALLNAARLLAGEQRPPCLVDAAELARFLGASQHMADLLVGRPELLTSLGRPFSPDAAAPAILAAGLCEERETALRHCQHEALLGIGWADLVAGADVEQVTWLISRLADLVLTAAVRGLGADQHFAVIALGKLGGLELNYSSDVDLVFVRPDEAADQVSADAIARRLIRLLDAQTEAGHLYRVDMRLRPEGSAGVLTRTVSSCLRYYRERGRPWERQMLTKGRLVVDAQQGHPGERFLTDTRTWILDCGMDAGAIRQFKRLKAATEAHHGDRADRPDVKQAPGGIRDIETIVQFLSLLHAARNATLLTNATLHGLERLRVAGAIGSIEAARLRSAYRFHRRLENRLQVMHRVQTHRLPADRVELARLMDLRDAESLDATLAEHRRRVREIFHDHFTRAFRDIEGPAAELAEIVLSGDSDAERPREILAELGYENPQAAMAAVQRMASPASRFLPLSPRLLQSFASIVPRLVERLSLAAGRDAALDRLERMTRGVGAREVLYAQLAQEPRLGDMLCDLASGSPPLADLLISEPQIFDGFIDSILTGIRGQRERRQLLTDATRPELGDPWLLLADHKNLETLHIGVRDLRELAPVRQTLANLSHLCIDILRTALAIVSSNARREHGTPETIKGLSRREAASMAVIAMGKVGGLEANYASDADLVFVYDGDGNTALTGLANRDYFTKVAEEFSAHVMGSRGGPRLYRVDTRLRPEGSKGPLVSSLRSFEAYYRSDRAALFEAQALLKARIVAGDAALGQRLQALIRKLLRKLTIPPDLGSQMREMRQRIELDALGSRPRKTPASAGLQDLKRGAGGMLDIEFMTQYMQLRHGREHPAILVPETARALELMGELDLIRPYVAEALRDSYLWMRRVEMRLQIASGLDTKLIPRDAPALRDLALRLDYADTAEGEAGQQLQADLDTTAQETRARFEELMG